MSATTKQVYFVYYTYRGMYKFRFMYYKSVELQLPLIMKLFLLTSVIKNVLLCTIDILLKIGCINCQVIICWKNNRYTYSHVYSIEVNEICIYLSGLHKILVSYVLSYRCNIKEIYLLSKKTWEMLLIFFLFKKNVLLCAWLTVLLEKQWHKNALRGLTSFKTLPISCLPLTLFQLSPFLYTCIFFQTLYFLI